MTRAWTPIAVEFAPAALNAIRTQVTHVVTPHSRQAQEVGGLLCGAIVEFATVSLVRIDRVIPVALGPVVLGADKQRFSKALAESSGEAIGWYRTQRSVKDPNSDAGRLAGDDDRIWSAELFPGRQSAFLICFPEEDLSLPGSLYIWTAGTDEVTTGVNLGRNLIPPDKPARQREPAPAPTVPVSAAAHTATEEKREPAPAVGSPMWSWNALVLVLAVAIVGVGGFFLVRGRLGTASERPADPQPAGIAMKVQRTGSELEVSWNPQAPKVTQATGGRLVIAEGARNETLKLSPQQLETGHLLYTSEAEDIRMDMEIAGPSGTYAESVRVAGGLPGLPAEPAIAAAAPPKIPVIMPAAKPLAPEKKPAQSIAAADVAPPSLPAPRKFVPPPHVTKAGNPVAARSEAPPPDAPQLATPVNVLTAGLPELKLPVPKPLQNAVQARPVQASPAQSKLEEYIGPRAIRSVQPAFDASANRTIDNAFSQNHEAHEVQIEVTIDEHGKVTKVSRGATTGPFAYLFVDAALAAARRWQFEPASVGGRPVASKMTLKFAFVRNRKNGGEN
jgi:TonB family protein